jgi:hypothetical protein
VLCVFRITLSVCVWSCVGRRVGAGREVEAGVSSSCGGAVDLVFVHTEQQLGRLFELESLQSSA